MKNLKLTLTSFLAIALLLVFSCKSRNENSDQSSKSAVTKGNTPEVLVAGDSLSDYAKLKLATNKLIAENEADIADFKFRLKTESTENQLKFKTQIDQLKLRNEVLKKDLESYKDKGVSEWNSFKVRVQKSIDDMNKDIQQYKKDHKY